MTLEHEIEEILENIIQHQKAKVLKIGRTFIPNLTIEDVLQPCDYPDLEYNPHFRYEEGVLEGVQTVRAALLALFRASDSSSKVN